MIFLPLYTDGQYFYRTPIEDNIYKFTITYVKGAQEHWVMDIADSMDAPILSGINLVMGSKNLLKGNNTSFNDLYLMAVYDEQIKDIMQLPKNANMFVIFVTKEEAAYVLPYPDRFDDLNAEGL